MARPTNDKKEQTVILRLNEEMRSEIEKEASEMSLSMSQYVRNIIKNRHNSVIQNQNSAVLKDIGMMAELFGIETGEMTEQFCEMLNDGLLTVSKGKLEIVMPEWAERFEETCHDRCMDVERTMEGVLKRL